jgi:hypothetical protein
MFSYYDLNFCELQRAFGAGIFASAAATFFLLFVVAQSYGFRCIASTFSTFK